MFRYNIFQSLKKKSREGYRVTVEPRFNEVPRDKRNWFIILRVRYIEVLLHTGAYILNSLMTFKERLIPGTYLNVTVLLACRSIMSSHSGRTQEKVICFHKSHIYRQQRVLMMLACVILSQMHHQCQSSIEIGQRHAPFGCAHTGREQARDCHIALSFPGFSFLVLFYLLIFFLATSVLNFTNFTIKRY